MANVLDASIETFLSSDENVDHQLLVKAWSASSVNAARMKWTLEKSGKVGKHTHFSIIFRHVSKKQLENPSRRGVDPSDVFVDVEVQFRVPVKLQSIKILGSAEDRKASKEMGQVMKSG